MKHFYTNIQGWSRFIPFYKDAIIEARDGAHFVEVGSWKGKSAAFMAVEIINSGKNIKFDCVDTWEGSDEPAHHNDPIVQQGKLYEHFLENMKPVAHIITPVRMESVEAAKLYDDESLDFVLIDAAHDYTNVIADLHAWWPKIKKGGATAGDDYRWSGVNKAVHEFFDNNKIETLKNKEGAGVCWRVRK